MNQRNRSRLPRALAAAALLLLTWSADVASYADADAVDDAVAQILSSEKAGESAKCVAKMRELKDSDDPRFGAAVRELSKSANDDVACAAIGICAAHKDAKAFEWLRSKIGDKTLFQSKGGRPEVYKCVLDSVALYKDPGALKPLEDVVKGFLTTDAEFSVRGIRAYAAVQQKSVVEQLIAWLGQLEERHGGKSSGGAGGHITYAPETQKIRDASVLALLDALGALTDQDLGDFTNWKKWWSEKSRTFEFPKADAFDKNVDVSSLSEWTDSRYGYKVKRPEGKGWEFKPRDAQFRVQILKTDEQGGWMGLVGWNAYRTAVSTIKDVKGYADWWISQQFPQHEFERYSPGGEPATERKSFAGREWTVITAKGVGKQGTLMAKWGPLEHRVYITKADCGFLYAWAVVKSGAPPEDQQKTWDVVESVVMTK